TNEIAQSEAATGKRFVKYWMHGGMLTMGEKMSKSLGNVFYLKDLKEFEDAIEDDLNMPKALQVLWKLVRDEKAVGKIQTIKKIDEVLGLDLLKKEKIKIPAEIKKLVEEREKFRKEKNWKKADKIRNKIKEKGWVVEDVNKESRVRKL
ncbi:MAG: hypothetical protein KKF67_00420, partial [Nanoarchaeota archaeon]|nr:hypothetical protein [Nanoarchaeota archaeon]